MSKCEKLIKNMYAPIIIVALLNLIVMCNVTLFGDDLNAFYNVLVEYNLSEWLNSRYKYWSSRTVIEAVLVTIVHYKFLWAIINTGMCALIMYTVAKICKIQIYKSYWFVALLFMVYPMGDMNSAGWIATTTNYLWVTATGMYALLNLQRIAEGIKLKKLQYLFSLIALLYATSQEQMAAILFGFTIVILVLNIINKRQLCFLTVQTIFTALMIFYHLMSPGNQARMIYEINAWFPEFEGMVPIGKFEIGISYTLYYFLIDGNVLFTLFSLILTTLVWKKSNKKIIRFFTVIPFGVSVIFGFMYDSLIQYCQPLKIVKDARNSCGIYINGLITLIPLAVLIILMFAIIFSLLYVFDQKEKKFKSIIILAAGFCSSAILGFSPTIYASGDRTFIFTNFAIVTVITMLYKQCGENNEKETNMWIGVVAILALVYYIGMLCF